VQNRELKTWNQTFPSDQVPPVSFG